MASTLMRVLLGAAVATWPAGGLNLRRGPAARMTPLFPEGAVPGPHIDYQDAGRTHEILSAYIRTPETVRIDENCNINGSLTESYYHVTNPGLESFALAEPPSRAAVIVVPGGGFSYVAWDKEGTFVAQWLNSLGISAFVLKYRVPVTHHNEIVKIDMERAMSTVRSKAHEYKIDSDRIGAMGLSAGGDPTTWVASGGYQGLRSYVRIDEIDDVPFQANFQLLIYAVTPTLQTWQHPSPTFIAHAADDPCVDPEGSAQYCLQVQLQANQSCAHFQYPNGGHGVGVCTGKWKYGVPHIHDDRGFNGADGWYNTWSGDSYCQWMDAAETWLRQLGIVL